MEELRAFRNNLVATHRAVRKGCTVTASGFCQAILSMSIGDREPDAVAQP
jgi:hypothetical protein